MIKTTISNKLFSKHASISFSAFLLSLQCLFVLAFVFCIFLIPFNVNAKSFTLCDGFSYEDIAKEYKLDVSEDVNFEKNKYIRYEDLKLLKIQYFGFDNKIHNGELVAAYKVTNPVTGEVVNVSKEILEIFKELLEKRYPINELSCFCFRNIFETKRLSWHAYGLAIDINCRENPCLLIGENDEIVKTIPENLEKYANRTLDEKGMIKIGDDCYNAFVNRGWEWGGSWNTPVDYMHFQKFPWYYRKPEAKY